MNINSTPKHSNHIKGMKEVNNFPLNTFQEFKYTEQHPINSLTSQYLIRFDLQFTP